MRARAVCGIVAILVVFGLLLPAGALAELLICKKCGYENESGSSACSHCRAPFASTPVEIKPAPAEPPAEQDQGPMSPAAVAEEIKLAREAYTRGDAEVARLFFVNASALNLVARAEPGAGQASLAERGGEITEAIKTCEAAALQSRVACPLCGGEGTQAGQFLSLDGSVTKKQIHGSKCPKCRGAGYVAGVRTVKDRRYMVGQAVRRFTEIQRGRGYVPVGNAWIPRNWESELTPRETARLKRATASPCDDCIGTGRIDCRKCQGIGEVRCTNSKCEGGKVREISRGQISKVTLPVTTTCKLCKGRGFEACEECRGRGALLCESCSGRGLRDACTKCDGKGLDACRRCKGTGQYREETCSECGGRKEVLCTTCNGDGRKQ